MLIDHIFFDNTFTGKNWYETETATSPDGTQLCYRWMPSGSKVTLDLRLPAKTNIIIKCSLLSVIEPRLLATLRVTAGSKKLTFRHDKRFDGGIGQQLEIFVPALDDDMSEIQMLAPFTIIPTNNDNRSLAIAFYDIKVTVANEQDLLRFLGGTIQQ